MSTLKVSSIQSPSTTDGGLAISSTGAVSGGLPVPNRNLLYNGAMQVAQRGTSATGITGSGYSTADRWRVANGTGGTWTESIATVGGTPVQYGFGKSVKWTCTTAEPSLTAGAQFAVEQRLEGQDLQRVCKGTSGAQQLTLSFWVRSNVTGTFVAWLYDADNARLAAASYTISTADVWQKQEITFPADTSGALDNDNGHSMNVRFWLAAGSNYTSGTLATEWESYTAANGAVGQTNLAAAVNNYWQITGVQLETGPVATEFEHRSFGDELARCQRYYIREDAVGGSEFFGIGYARSAGQAFIHTDFPVSMRTAPTSLETSGTATDYRINYASTATVCNAVPTFSTASSKWAAVTSFTVSSGLTTGYGCGGQPNTTNAYLAWSAEL